MRIRVCRSKNAGVAGYAEAFRPVQSDSQTSEWYSYFENDVLVYSYFEIDVLIYGRIILSAPIIRSVMVYISVTFPTKSFSIRP